MTDTSASFDTYSFGTYSNGVFSATGDRVGSGISNVYIVDNNQSDTIIPANSTVTFNFTQSDGSTFSAQATYLGYFQDTDNVQHPFVYDGSNYFLVGEPGKSSQTYAITAAAYTQGTVTCFTTGTWIRVLRDSAETDVPVEHLAIGDLALTGSGAHRPIKWIGHRTIDPRHHPRPREAMPVRISAQAFGPDKPARDLWVSPGHSICVDVLGEVLIPALALINGTTIQQVEIDAVTYWHVELDSHDILIAENLRAESYLDMGNRGFFREAAVVDLLAGPDGNPAERTHADFCRPFHAEGPLVDAVRQQIGLRAAALGWTLEHAPLADLHLVVDGERIEPAVRGLTAHFLVPARAQDLWLVSHTSRPSEISSSADGRNLGVCLSGLAIDDGFGPMRPLDLADPLLCTGFHDVEDGTRRWTAGRARLPVALWDDCPDGFVLRIDLAGPALSRWVAPLAAMAEQDNTYLLSGSCPAAA